MKILGFTAVLLCCLLFNNCANSQSVDANTFEKALTKKAQLLDVRTLEEYNEGHIPNALLIDVNGDEEEFHRKTDALDKQQPVYVYCRSGARSRRAADILKERGFKNVLELKGGIVAWGKAGKTVVEGSQPKSAR
jgi:rhodanese-related sulfurtransferase